MSAQEGGSPSSSSADTSTRVATLERDLALLGTQSQAQFTALTAQLNTIAAALSIDKDAPPTDAPLPGNTPPVNHPGGGLVGSLPKPTASRVPPAALERCLDTRDYFGGHGSLGYYDRPAHHTDYPSRRFAPTQEGLYRRIVEMARRDGHEAQQMWNMGYNLEMAIAASHNRKDAAAAGHHQLAEEDAAVQDHYMEAAYQRLGERCDYFLECLEYGKQQATTRANTLRDTTHPYQSPQYRETNEDMARLRAAAYAKETVRQEIAKHSRTTTDAPKRPTQATGKPYQSARGQAK